MNRFANRRRFLKNTAWAGIGLWTAGSAGVGQGQSPNEKLNIGIIGSDGRGGANTRSVSSENIAAWLYSELQPRFEDTPVRLTNVEVWESPTAGASYSP